MKAEIARHIVENGGLLAKDSVLHLLDCIESADRKIEQLIADRQQAISELAAAQRERDGYLHSSTVYSDRAFKAEAELKRRDAQEPVAWAHRLINKSNGVAHHWKYGSAEKEPSEGDIFRIEVVPLHAAAPAAVLPPEPKETDCPEWIADPFSWACGAGWMRDKAIAMGSKPMPVIVLKGGSLKSDGNIWYKSETVGQLIRAAGLEVNSEMDRK